MERMRWGSLCGAGEEVRVSLGCDFHLLLDVSLHFLPFSRVLLSGDSYCFLLFSLSLYRLLALNM